MRFRFTTVLFIFVIGTHLLCWRAFSQTPVFYLNANGVIGSNTFVDSGPNNYPITVNGNPINDTACGNTVVAIDGTTWAPSGHYLFAPYTPNFDFGSTDFTIHFWVYLKNISSTHAAFDFRTSAAEHIFFVHYPATGWMFSDRQGAGTLVAQSTETMPAQIWTHVALVRSGNNFTIYINGCVAATATNAVAVSNSTGLQIGYSWDNRDQLNGYIDEFYIYKGTALWNAPFTPPTCPAFAACVSCNTQALTNVTKSNIRCKGDSTGSISLSPTGGTPPYHYNWNTGATSSSISGLPAGTYTVHTTDQSCFSVFDTIVLTEPAMALVAQTNYTDTIVCNSQSIFTVAHASGGTAPYTYLWNNSTSDSSQTILFTADSIFNITVADTNGCTVTQHVNISIDSTFAEFSAMPVCKGDTTFFSNTSTTNNPALTYLWSFGDNNSSAIINPKHVYTSAGTYTTQLIVVSNSGCINTSSHQVVIHPTPVAKFSVDSVCYETPITLTDSSHIAFTDTINQWLWNFGDGSPLNTNQNITGGYLYASSGNYTITLKVTSAFGCADSIFKTTVVNPLPLPQFTANDSSGCSALCVHFTNLSSAPGATIALSTWAFGDGETFSSVQDITHCYQNDTTPLKTFSVMLTVVSEIGCSNSLTRLNLITVYPNPTASFSANPQTASISEPLIQLVNLSAGATSYWWQFGNTQTDTSSIPASIVYTDTGSYTITLIATNQYSCNDTSIETVVIEPDFKFYIPNSFSPNDDGTNDNFAPKGDFISSYEMSIFDRWGNLIFKTNDISKAWNGKAQSGNDIAQRDTYVYLIKVTDFKLQTHTYRGTVTLIK